jgi:hypothetical protein
MTDAFIHGRIVRETEKALLISCKLEQGDEPVSGGVWLPRSQVELLGAVHAIEAERNPTYAAVMLRTEPDACVFKIPAWLARKSGVCFGMRA